MAVVEGLGRNLPDARHRAGHRDPDRAVLIQALHQVGVDPPVGVVLRHADLLGDDALLLLHALIREVGHGHKAEQQAEVFIEVLRTLHVVGGDGVAGEGVVIGAVFGELLEHVPLLGVKHLVLQVVGDAGGGVQPASVQLEAQVHAAVPGGKKGVAAGVARLAGHHHLQAVGQPVPVNLFSQTGVFLHDHSCVSFPLRK